MNPNDPNHNFDVLSGYFGEILSKTSVNLDVARGRDLDNIANMYGIGRKHYWWIFRERDRTLKRRVVAVLIDRYKW